MNTEIVAKENSLGDWKKKNVKIATELWCNPPAIIYDSLCSIQSMFSSCTALSVKEKG